MNDRKSMEIILDHYHHPVNRGRLGDPRISAHDSNPLCGDEVTIHVRVRDGIIEDAKFEGKGCSISMASTDLLLSRIKGKSVEEALSLRKEDILDMLGMELGPVRLKCALLPLKVLKLTLLKGHKSD